MPHSVAEEAHVFTLIVRPDISTLAITNVILERASEGALIVIIYDATITVESTILVPIALISAASNLDNTLTHQLSFAWLIISRR